MRTTGTPKLAAQRLAEAAGFELDGNVLVADGNRFVGDDWLRVLGYIIDLMMAKKGLAMTAREVWELCRFEPRRSVVSEKRGDLYFVVPDHGWPSLAIAAMLREHDDVRSGDVGGVLV